ncbi:MAG TPA: RNA polymerase sigma factor, partial [Puia sp.]|nr:RNA polymerase sigma factor [Puia sp.]
MVETEALQQLISGCARNDRASQEKLYKQFYAPLFSLCRRFFQNDHEAIESVNDGMLKVFEKIGSYREGKGRFFNWMYTIVRNTAVDKFRASVPIPVIGLQEPEEAIPEPDIGGNPGAWLEQKELALLFDRLSPAPRG